MFSVVLNWLSGQQGPLGLLIALLVAAGGTAASYLRSRREKLLSFRVRFNSRLGFNPPDAGNVVQLFDPDGNEIPDPGMVVARIKNVGRKSITEHDYVHPLGLTFPDATRRLVTVDVTEAKPGNLQRLLTGPGFEVVGNRIVLPKVHLNPGSEFKLVALLAHTTGPGKPTVETDGILRGGRIFLDADGRRLRRGTLIGGAITALLAGALTAVVLVQPPAPPRPMCATGALTVEGSSAFGGAVEQIARQYETECPGASIDVLAGGSFEGLDHLKNAPAAERPRRLALADGRFTDAEEFRDLDIAESLAVVPYSFVVHRDVPIEDISPHALREIFLGRTADWSELPPDVGKPRLPALEVRVVGRDNHSGSRRVVEQTLLDGEAQARPTSDTCAGRRDGVPATAPIVCEQGSTSDVLRKVADNPGAIGYVDAPNAITAEPGVKRVTVGGHAATVEDIATGYRIWTVEYLYSYGPLAETDPLTRAFAAYLVSPTSASAIGALRYTPCVRADGTPERLCD